MTNDEPEDVKLVVELNLQLLNAILDVEKHCPVYEISSSDSQEEGSSSDITLFGPIIIDLSIQSACFRLRSVMFISRMLMIRKLSLF